MRLCSITPGLTGDWELRVYEIDHAGTRGRKSSAVTAPRDTDLILAPSSQDGLVNPRRRRLMVVRSTLSFEATVSSLRPSEAIHLSSFMEGNVHHAHNSCQAPCASGVVDYGTAVRTMHAMAKTKAKSIKKQKKPKWGRNYILEWRTGCGLSQEELAELMGYKSHSTVQRVEGGTTAYTQPFLERAAHVFLCRVGDLLNGPPSQEAINAFKAQQRRIAS